MRNVLAETCKYKIPIKMSDTAFKRSWWLIKNLLPTLKFLSQNYLGEKRVSSQTKTCELSTGHSRNDRTKQNHDIMGDVVRIPMRAKGCQSNAYNQLFSYYRLYVVDKVLGLRALVY